jgi:hypothetical protein
MAFSFFDKKSEKKHYSLLKKENHYKSFIDNFMQKRFDSEFNFIPSNNYISLLCFQSIEIYSRVDDVSIKKIFYKFAKLSSGDDKRKYSNLKKEADKVIESLINGKYIRSSHVLREFTIKLKNNNIISYFNISLDSIGPSLYRINFNFFLNDVVRYEFWLAATGNFDSLLQIRSNLFRAGYSFTNYNGNNRKSETLVKIQTDIRSEINKIIKQIAPGIFSKIYKNIPCVIIIEYDDVSILNKSSVYNINDETDFSKIIINDDFKHDVHYNDYEFGNLYVPSVHDEFKSPSIYAKHFRNRCSIITPTNELFWINVIKSLYGIQFDLIRNIKNHYVFKSIHNSNDSFKKKRKKLNQLDAIIDLVGSGYEIEKEFISRRLESKIVYYDSMQRDKKTDYFANYIRSIDYTKEKINGLLPQLKSSYDARKDDINENVNIRFQIIAFILTIFTIFQTFYQCNQDTQKEKKELPVYLIISPNNILVNKK